jgi:hypothetical protein
MADDPVNAPTDPPPKNPHRPIRKQPSPLQAPVVSVPDSHKKAPGENTMASKDAPQQNKSSRPAASKSYTWVDKTAPAPKAGQANKGRPVGSKNKPKEQTAPAKVKTTAAKRNKPMADDLKKLARFDWLLRQFINSANALQEEFGGIPDQIDIVLDRYNKYHGLFPVQFLQALKVDLLTFS